MIEEFKSAASVIAVLIFGIAFGVAVSRTAFVSGQALDVAKQAVGINEGIKRELNEKVLPSLQKRLEALEDKKK